mmetsp:Transcript_17741/g.35781  ORF Transcript_17741/g.35781 Transcript_17741/m.35781 type:complete len:197 (+) Transcript_17741:13-603(+)
MKDDTRDYDGSTNPDELLGELAVLRAKIMQAAEKDSVVGETLLRQASQAFSEELRKKSGSTSTLKNAGAMVLGQDRRRRGKSAPPLPACRKDKPMRSKSENGRFRPGNFGSRTQQDYEKLEQLARMSRLQSKPQHEYIPDKEYRAGSRMDGVAPVMHFKHVHQDASVPEEKHLSTLAKLVHNVAAPTQPHLAPVYS